MARKRTLIILCIALLFMLCLNGNAIRDNPIITASAASSQNCNTRDNLRETARSFAGRCCKGSIKEVFPGEYWDSTLGEIQDACSVGGRRGCDDGDDEPSASSAKNAQKAWKLLDQARFRK